jgi:DNA-binding MarR family transcriptional regulator
MRVKPMSTIMKNGKSGESSSNGHGRPFLEEQLSDLLAQANHLMTERLYAQARWRRVGIIEWRVLSILSRQDGLAMSELAMRVLTKQPTLTKAIDRMERAGLVQRRTPDQDRRRTLVLITEQGRQLAAPLVAEARSQEGAVVSEQGEGDARQLKLLLRQLIERLSGHERPRARPDLHVGVRRRVGERRL